MFSKFFPYKLYYDRIAKTYHSSSVDSWLTPTRDREGTDEEIFWYETSLRPRRFGPSYLPLENWYRQNFQTWFSAKHIGPDVERISKWSPVMAWCALTYFRFVDAVNWHVPRSAIPRISRNIHRLYCVFLARVCKCGLIEMHSARKIEERSANLFGKRLYLLTLWKRLEVFKLAKHPLTRKSCEIRIFIP